MRYRKCFALPTVLAALLSVTSSTRAQVSDIGAERHAVWLLRLCPYASAHHMDTPPRHGCRKITLERWRGLDYHESYMAGKDTLRPRKSDHLKRPPIGLSPEQNQRGFSASDTSRRKCSGLDCMSVFPPTTSRRFRCRTAPCESTPPNGAGRSPCKSARSAQFRCGCIADYRSQLSASV